MIDGSGVPPAPSQLPLFGGAAVAVTSPAGGAGPRVAPWPAVTGSTALDGAAGAAGCGS
jgi:hypothetical protein